MDIDKTLDDLEMMRVSVPLKDEVKLRNAIKLIEQLTILQKRHLKANDKLTAQIDELQEKYDKLTRPNDAWISVEDELPEMGRIVIITDGALSYCACRVEHDTWDYQIVDDNMSSNAIMAKNVIGWQPLPTPPKQSEGSER